MKKIILLLSITCLFANQMQVEGNLDVSGNIQSPTISELQDIIIQLEQRIGDLENQINEQYLHVSSRQYNLTVEPGDLIDLESLTGQLLDWYMIDIVKVSEAGDWNSLNLYSIGHSNAMVRGESQSNEAYYVYADNHPLLVTSQYKLLRVENINQSANITLMITGPFQTQSNLRKNSNKDTK